jgi:hypothetical protein
MSAKYQFPRTIFFGDEFSLNERIKAFVNLSGGRSDQELMCEIFDAGIIVLAEQSGIRIDPLLLAIREAEAEDQRFNHLTKLRRKWGDNRFEVWCHEHDVDPGPIINAPIELNLQTRQQWLDELLDDRQEYLVKEIKEAALRSGFDAADWPRFEAYAGRKGYKKSYGVWQRRD